MNCILYLHLLPEYSSTSVCWRLKSRLWGSTWPLVNSAKTEMQVQKELDKKRFLTSAPHGRGATHYTETGVPGYDLLRNWILKSFRSCHNNSLRKNIPITHCSWTEWVQMVVPWGYWDVIGLWVLCFGEASLTKSVLWITGWLGWN